MKKLSLLLAILLIVSFGVYASDDAKEQDTSFDIKTTIFEVNQIGVTAADLGGATSWDGTTAITQHGVSTAADLAPTDPIAYLSVITNNRTGYKINMSVNAMASGANYINYELIVNGKTVGTNNGTTVTETDIITVSSLSGLTGTSYAIKLDVNSSEFANAVSGNYSGTVKFDYTAN
jgi:hypothetical protein